MNLNINRKDRITIIAALECLKYQTKWQKPAMDEEIEALIDKVVNL